MIQKMKGTYDITEDISYYHAIEKKIQSISKLFGFKEIRTPHFEASELFHRSVGEDSDIVSKETYDFTDRSNRALTLRPEGTAGVARALIENKMYANPVSPQKYYYVGSMFRYERPQKGRFREFRQFGAEAFGSLHPQMDAEVIAYAFTLIKALKLTGIKVHLNSLGGAESKQMFKGALKEHLAPSVDTLCKDCQRRYEENPLRILDCKVDANHEALKTAPKPLDYMTEEDQAHFKQVLKYLDLMNIEYVVDHNLVRGLDYYTHTVFEIKVSESLLGSQNTICGGGRYNELIETLGGPSVPAVGFSFGLERLLVALKAADFKVEDDYTHVYMLIMGDAARALAMQLMQRLRLGGLMCDADFLEKSFKAQFKQSAHKNARFVVIIGEDEVNNQTVTVKDQKEGQEEKVHINDLYMYLVELLTKKTSSCDSCDHQGGK